MVGETADGELILDVHHTRHPASRDRKGSAGVSIMATGDYAALRRRYGAQLVDGSAGGTVLIDHPGLAETVAGELRAAVRSAGSS